MDTQAIIQNLINNKEKIQKSIENIDSKIKSIESNLSYISPNISDEVKTDFKGLFNRRKNFEGNDYSDYYKTNIVNASPFFYSGENYSQFIDLNKLSFVSNSTNESEYIFVTVISFKENSLSSKSGGTYLLGSVFDQYII
jgi:roadblock/LC7 domain-containing protein